MGLVTVASCFDRRQLIPAQRAIAAARHQNIRPGDLTDIGGGRSGGLVSRNGICCSLAWTLLFAV